MKVVNENQFVQSDNEVVSDNINVVDNETLGGDERLRLRWV